MRKYALGLILLLFVIAIFGHPRWIELWRWAWGEPPMWLVATVDKLRAIEQWITQYISYPGIFALGVTALAIWLEWPQISVWFFQREREKAWFLRQFEATATHRARIRQIGDRNYEAWRSPHHPLQLSDLVRRASLPGSLPLPNAGNLRLFSRTQMASQLDPTTTDLYGFLQDRFYPPGPSQDDAADESRQKAAKFWDEVGRKVEDGRLRIEDIQTQLKTQASDLLILPLLEIAKVQQGGWGEGAGTSGLFYICHQARELD